MARQKIVIVDDSRIIRMQVRDMLPQGNFEVFEAKDGAEGIDVIQQEQPSLVVIDFFMPNMNGWEVVQRMQKDAVLCRIPVVMMSGRKEDVVAAVPELFDYFEFLSKPFDAPVLMKAIKAAMIKAKDRRQVKPMVAAAAVDSNGQTSRLAPAVETQPSRDEAHHLLETLRADIKTLKTHNAHLQSEVNTLKKQVTQLVSFVRKKLQ
ncbi:response regulator [Leptolyngbya sp. CCY15150]|uniref:response regulator n=1 Tax=Leptolyngbya sp. CCY15150 TaxID=2767772 RepID=UPI001951756A|nr:response regulator [Leptolyngbya sp. CCY15150]